MDSFGARFNYNNIWSSDILDGLALVGRKKDEPYEMGIDRQLITGDFNRFRRTVNHMGAKYLNPLSFQITVMKDPCKHSNQNDLYFTRQEISTINRWLTGTDYPTYFYFEDEFYESMPVYYRAVITAVDSVVIGQYIYELTYTVTCDSPFAWSGNINVTNAGQSTMTVNNNGDDITGYVYPIIMFNNTGSGNEIVTLTSVDDKKSIQLNVSGGSTLYLNTQTNVFSSKDNATGAVSVMKIKDVVLSPIDSLYIPRLRNGVNTFNISGSGCTVTFSYRIPFKVGAY